MKRPNFVWIQTDEHRPDSLGCYGSPWARTPYIDSLARRGVTFTNCVCNSPVCVPSRASQLTGRYPQEVGVVTNAVFEMDDIYPATTVTFPELFARHGYATASFGKWHTPNHATWQTNKPLINVEEYASYYSLAERYDETVHHVLKRAKGTPIILAGTYPVAHGHPSQVITDWAIDWLRCLPKGQPFVLRVSHNWPHTPVLPPPPFDRIYDPAELPIRCHDHDAYRSRAAYDRRAADAHGMLDLTREQLEQVWKDYMGLVACVDHEVGRVLSCLTQLDLIDDTILLVSADHGKALGEWGATEKGFFDSEVWRVPFVLAGPGIPRHGARCAELCELVDTGPTLLGLAGIQAPEVYRGRDLMRDPAPEAVFGQIGWPGTNGELFHRYAQRSQPNGDIRGRDLDVWSRFRDQAQQGIRPSAAMRVAVRTRAHRMDVTWLRDGDQVPMQEADGNLFDLRTDPLERRNLWAEPDAQPIVLDLWHRIENWMASLHRPTNLFGRSD